MKKILLTICVIIALSTIGGLGYTYFKIRYGPERSAHFVRLAQSSLEAGGTQESETYARRALYWNEKSGAAHFILAGSLALNRSALPEEILNHYRKAESFGVVSAALYAGMAEAEMEIRDWKAAEETLAKANIKFPGNILTDYFTTVFLLFGKKDADAAVKTAEEIIKRNPNDPTAGRIFALSLYKNNRISEAESAVDKALSSTPDSCALRALKAEIIKTKSPNESELLIREVESMALEDLKTNRMNITANYCLAHAYSLKGDLVIMNNEPEELARAFYEQAMSVNIPRGGISDYFRQSAIDALGLSR